MEEIQILIAESSYDIIALNEVKPKNGEIGSLSLLNIQGYELFYSDFEKLDTRGVCIYIKKHLSASQIVPPSIKEFNDVVWVSITENRSNDKVLFGCVYRSGTQATAKKYDKALHEHMLWASQESGYCDKVIVGDFNQPNVNWTPEPSITPRQSRSSSTYLNCEELFVECIRDTFFHQHVMEDTRHRNSRSSSLDLLFTDDVNTVQSLKCLDPVGASDHVGIEFDIPSNIGIYPHKIIKLSYNKGDYDRLRTMMDIDWDAVLPVDNIQSAYDKFEEILNEGISKCIPVYEMSNKKSTKPIWMTQYATDSRKVKYRLWSKYKQTRHRGDFADYTRARNNCTHKLRKARRQFEKSLAKNLKSNSKAFWNYVNSKRKNKSKVSDLYDESGILQSDDTEKASILNQQYAKTFSQEVSGNNSDFAQFPLQTEPLAFIIIIENDVKELLLCLKIDKSPGPDKLHPRVLKELANQIAKPLTLLFQMSLNQGKVPEQWKFANVTPIYKKGSKSSPVNYRPVSLTSIVCKLLEKLVAKHILSHAQSNGIIPDQQHGFLSGRSTSTNLLEALNIWIELMQHDIPVDILYLDYAKAFDTIPHQRLLQKLKSLGIQGAILKWIEDFLTDRKQRVVVNFTFSQWIEVLSGVPQGTVLGPLLFLLFVSDIPEVVSNFVSLFADDTKLYGKCQDDSLQRDLDSLVRWTQSMQMAFNSDKCKVMHLGKRNLNKEYTMVDKNGELKVLESTSIEKDLGVHIDNELSFNEHITKQVIKANRALGALKHTIKYMDKDSFTCLYKSLIRPHLEYASVAWSTKTKYHQDMIERVQRRATKLVPHIKHLQYTERLECLQLPSLHYRRKRADVIQMFKFVHDIDYFDFDRECSICNRPTFEKSLGSSAMNTRGHPYKFQIHLCQAAKKKSFFGRVIPMWNNLKAKTVCSETVNEFKGNLALEWSDPSELYGYVFSY